MFETIMGVPAHPLFVHGAAVFAPVAAILVLVWMLKKTSRGFHTLAAISTGLALVSIFLARSSGSALLVMQGHSEENPGPLADHILWANIMTGAVIVMTIALLGVLVVQVKMQNNLLAGVCKTVVVIAAIALLVACAFAGHAGAVQVWSN